MNQSKWPARGEMSEDGRYYTHTDGSVHELVDTNLRDWEMCSPCSMFLRCDRSSCSEICTDTHNMRLVHDAYVQSDDELAACEAMRGMIARCSKRSGGGALGFDTVGCKWCEYSDKNVHGCPARAWLARCGQADAWEVTV